MKKGQTIREFKQEHCEHLIRFMSQGFSFEAFCGEIGIGRTTGYEWLKKHKDFAEAKEIAVDANLRFWENEGITGLYGNKDSHLNSSVWIFNMKNRHGWRDRTEVFGKDEGPIMFQNLTEGQVDEKVMALCARLLPENRSSKEVETETTDKELSPPDTTD